MDVAELLGNKEAVEHWNHFYELLTFTYKLNRKAEMEGMSRGAFTCMRGRRPIPTKWLRSTLMHRCVILPAGRLLCELENQIRMDGRWSLQHLGFTT